MKEGVTICLSAWKTQDYIEETLDSIEHQSYFKDNDNYEILLGIDGCKETLKKVQQIRKKYRNLKVFMMTKNCGTYVTCNTMLDMAKYDWFLRFDTDDIMLPDMVEVLMKEKGDSDLIRFKLENFPGKREIRLTHGQILIKTSLLKKYGGYMPWKCSADTELIARTSGHIKQKTINKVLMKRRLHESNLTIEESSCMKSKLRTEYFKYIKAESCKKHTIKITGESYIEIKPDFESIDELKIEPHEVWDFIYKKEFADKREECSPVKTANHYTNILIRKGPDVTIKKIKH